MSQIAVKLQDEGRTSYSPHTQFFIVYGLLPQPVVMGIYKTEKKQEAGTQEIKKCHN
jgi:hypothetical protein